MSGQAVMRTLAGTGTGWTVTASNPDGEAPKALRAATAAPKAKIRCTCKGCNPTRSAAADNAVPPAPDFVEAIRAARDPRTRGERLDAIVAERVSALSAGLVAAPPAPAPKAAAFDRAPAPPDFIEACRQARRGAS
jgi:hypothetical protein